MMADDLRYIAGCVMWIFSVFVIVLEKGVVSRVFVVILAVSISFFASFLESVIVFLVCFQNERAMQNMMQPIVSIIVRTINVHKISSSITIVTVSLSLVVDGGDGVGVGDKDAVCSLIVHEYEYEELLLPRQDME